jgi:hypothetical protein
VKSQFIVDGYPTSPECAIFEDPLSDAVTLAMPGLESAGSILSLITLELTAYILWRRQPSQVST